MKNSSLNPSNDTEIKARRPSPHTPITINYLSPTMENAPLINQTNTKNNTQVLSKPEPQIKIHSSYELKDSIKNSPEVSNENKAKSPRQSPEQSPRKSPEQSPVADKK